MSALTSIDIVNFASGPSIAAALPAIVAALGKQLALHLQPLWGRPIPTLHLRASAPAGDVTLAIFDDADQAGALGYHDETPQGLAYGKVFAGIILANGGTVSQSANSISTTLSHELLEMVGDPSCNWWADNTDGYSYALELADAVEEDSYLIDNIHVSNFVTPAFFDPHAPHGSRLDYLKKLARPFTMTPGGYQIRRRADGQVNNVFGHQYPRWKHAMKNHAAARTVRRVQRPHHFSAEFHHVERPTTPSAVATPAAPTTEPELPTTKE